MEFIANLQISIASVRDKSVLIVVTCFEEIEREKDKEAIE